MGVVRAEPDREVAVNQEGGEEVRKVVHVDGEIKVLDNVKPAMNSKGDEEVKQRRR
jgi:hypothetical protein